MKKIALIILVFMSFAQLSKAQDFVHEGGVGIYVFMESEDMVGALPAFVYSPRLNVAEIGRSAILSVGSHIGLGFMYNSQEGGYFGMDLPVVAELHMGFGADPGGRSRESFGGYFGAGMGYSFITGSVNTSDGFVQAAGVIATAGVRYTYKDNPVRLGTSFLYGLNENNPFVIGVNVAFIFSAR